MPRQHLADLAASAGNDDAQFSIASCRHITHKLNMFNYRAAGVASQVQSQSVKNWKMIRRRYK